MSLLDLPRPDPSAGVDRYQGKSRCLTAVRETAVLTSYLGSERVGGRGQEILKSLRLVPHRAPFRAQPSPSCSPYSMGPDITSRIVYIATRLLDGIDAAPPP